MGRLSKWVAAGVVVCLAGLFGLVASAGSADAAITKAFGLRYQTDDTGDILLRGNSLVTCPAAATNCLAARSNSLTGTPMNNNAYSMEYVDNDSDSSTVSSSTANVALPAGATVKFAGLYWSGYSTAGNGRTAPSGVTKKNELLFKVPGGAYETITAAPASDFPVDGTASNGTPYLAFADVTAKVQTSGDYTAANIYAATGPDAYAAWALVLVIRDPTLPQRHMVVFDGFGTIESGDTSLDIGLTGLSTPPSGAIDVRLGAVVFEGDAGLTGDQFQFIPPSGATTVLSNAVNPADNPFNSTVSDNGVDVAGRVPDGNTFGFDADVFQSSALIGPSESTATLRMSTSGETFFPAVASFVSNIYAPRLDLVRSASVTDGSGDSRTRPGDLIRYTIKVTNNGQADSTGTRITDAIPAGTDYVAGSLQVDGAAVSDAADTDTGELSSGTLAVRLGTGAGGSGGSGGTLAPAAATTVTYVVRVTGQYTTGGAITGVTGATYSDPQSRSFSTSSNTTSTTVDPARTDLTVTQTTSPAVVQASGSRTVSWAVKVTNNGPDTETAPVLKETLPTGVTGVSVSGATCTLASGTYTCPLSSLADDASTTVTFTATLPATASDPSAASAVVSGAGTDPVTGNNTNSTGVGVNAPPDATGDLAALNSPSLSTDIDVLANDDDPDAADTLTLSSVTAPAHGTATIVGGKVNYTLDDVDFIGTDTFTYTTCDGRGGCDTATVSVAVNDHRRADLKVTQVAAPTVVQRGGSLAVTWNATVVNQGPQSEPSPVLVQKLPTGVTGVTATGATCTTSGTTLTCALGALASGASATVKFAATLPSTATDPSSATATVSGAIADPDASNNAVTTPIGVNRSPVATSDTGSLPADVLTADLDATKNDTDPDGDTLTISSVTSPAHGSASIVGGRIRYTLTDSTFVGDETFSYTVCDGRGACDSASVTVAVADHEVADLGVTQTAGPKVLQRDGSRVATWTATVRNAGPERALAPVLTQTLPAGVTGVATSLAACTVSGVVATCPLTGLDSGETTEITFTATVPADAADPATASAAVKGGSPDPDSTNNTATASVALNTPPVATDDAATLGSSVLRMTIDALAGVSDADDDPLTLKSVGKPAHGTATIVDGKIRYLLTDTDFTGEDTFSYVACDDRSGCDTAQITVTVAGRQHEPSATGDTATVVTGSTVKIDVLANDTDADGGTLTLKRITRAPEHGTAKVVKGKIVYTPDDGYVGTDTVRYEVCDSGGLCSQATAKIAVTAQPPVLKPDTGDVRPGGSTLIDVLGNDSDPAGYPLGSVTIIRYPGTGTATVKGNQIRYQAPSGLKAGTEVTIGYQVCNKAGACSDGEVVLTVAGTPVSGGGLAFTGTRMLGPVAVTGITLILAGLMTHRLVARPRERVRVRTHGRHKA
ncbi:tandem-95 repeat protein [Kineosporia sp. J2-2]|uniref:Tandem-95 repeat protein n=1 Tax=Kineosporia corallincola TaxID=2835133 RepID=A0ABS5TK22_9ACTN|nr:Ig-like domain-containing protein [Kineosporia corallincola]MBT0771451.1 tandem-95 repeat protein [Kineosporia corallincola]